MGRYLMIVAVTIVVLVWGSGAPADVVIDTVTVGNAGNAPDTRYSWYGYGGVDYCYSMGTYEVTAGQYTAFLNAVAASDTYSLYDSNMWSHYSGCRIERSGSPGSYTYSVAPDWANRPVNWVDWGDAVRFTNWLHNGQPSGAQDSTSTEDGSYNVLGALSDTELTDVVRQPEATWVIPTKDEWYKAAYHKNDGITGNYFDYPTSSDVAPSNDLIEPDPGNKANFLDDDYTIGAPYFRTEIGEFENSASPYGTFDQGGNLFEWNEATRWVDPSGGSSYTARYLLGGEAFRDVEYLHASNPGMLADGSLELSFGGFRVALIPEPGSLVLVALGGAMLLRRKRLGR